jgi:transketolase
LGKGGEPVNHTARLRLGVGEGIVVREGSDVTLATSTGTLDLTLYAAASLEVEAVSAQVLSFPTIQPFDFSLLSRSLAKTGRLITIEEHGKGGLGSIVSEWLAVSDLRTKFRPLCVNGAPGNTAGGREALRERAGLTVENVVQLAKSLL